MRLTIVIPAYNEEKAIASIIERCLAARAYITATSPVRDVEIVVVSDGSTDRTVEIASRCASKNDDLKLIVFERNRGYGAAIKRGFEESSSELVGFLDADGTCDPRFFADLCNAICDENADVAIGSRMSPQSRMPRLRRLGNRCYAAILSLLSNHVVTDTASGMRVIRREALNRLYPLPDGLHFTPAMSARVLMDDKLKLVECPMSYEERIGESKLRIMSDGWRFLRIIMEMGLVWQPRRFFFTAAMFCFTLMTLLAMHPVEMWLNVGHLHEDMIYRLLFCSMMGTFGVALLSATVISDNLNRLWNDRPQQQTYLYSLLGRAFSNRGAMAMVVPSVGMLTWLVGGGCWTWMKYGYVHQHWSRVVLAGLIAFGLGQMFVTVSIVNVIRFHTTRKALTSRLRIEKSANALRESLVIRTTLPETIQVLDQQKLERNSPQSGREQLEPTQIR